MTSGTASGTIVNVGGVEVVASGGSDADALISGGTTQVLSGGVASGDTIFAGSQVVSSGGTAVNDKISGGTVVLESSAVLSGGIAFAGSGTLEIVGSAMPSATISGFTFGDVIDLASVAPVAGGIAVLTSGNVLDVVEGGSTYVLDLDPSQNYSGTVFVLTSDGSGGVDVTNILNPISVTVSSGTLTVSSGRTSGGVLVLSGATLNIQSGGTASGTTLNRGGTDRVSGRDMGATLSGVEVVSRTGVASGATVLASGSQTDLGVTVATVVSSGTETVSSGGTASNTVISSGGSLVVLTHGIADPATIYSGGSETIGKGGTDLGAHISGGIQIVSGLVSGATIFAGSQVVRSAGTAIGTTVSNAGVEVVSSGGTTSGTRLTGGQEIVSRGGRSSGTDILSGGGEIVSSGGSALATTISGGTLEVASGGTASGVVFSSGGILQLDSSSHLSGTISGFHLGDEIDLRGLAFSSSSSTLTWKQTTSGANASGTLTVKEGTSSTTLTLVGSYTVSNFSATSDGRGGTLITDPPIMSGAVVTSSGTGSGSEGIAGAPGGDTTVHSGGYELGGGGSQPAEANGVFFSGGGMIQLDSLLSQFAGVISGFDLGDDIGPHSLGFGSSSNAMSWMRESAPRVDKEGNISNLSLLGQYSAANFDAGADSHGGTLVTDPPASSSVVETPLVVHHP